MMEAALPLLLKAALAAVSMMALLWLLHLAVKDAALVDVGWGIGIGLLPLVYAVEGPGYPLRKWLLAGLALLWGWRLALHLLFDRIIGKPEEGRYQELRRKWKTNLPLKFFFFYQFQAALLMVLSIPALLACLNSRTAIALLEWSAAAIWLIGVIGEAAADAQLAAWKKNPANKGRTCRAGLWNYSRHPNYFFEWLIWVAYALFATASPWGWAAWFAPALMLFFLFKVTGIPATEQQALRSRGDDYRQYQATTSVFVPWIPKKV